MNRTLLIVIGFLAAVIAAAGCSTLPITPEQQFINNIQKWYKKNFTDQLAVSQTGEIIKFEGSVGVVKDYRMAEDVGVFGFITGFVFQEFKALESPKTKHPVSKPDLDKTLKIFSDIDREKASYPKESDSNIIIAPGRETQWGIIRNILECCGKNLIWKTYFLVSRDGSNFGVIPIFLPKIRDGIIYPRLDLLKITIRLHKNHKSDTPEWALFEKSIRDGLARYMKEYVAVFLKENGEEWKHAELQIDKEVSFNEIIKVIDIIRQTDIKDNVTFSVLFPKSTDSDFQIESDDEMIEEVIENDENNNE